MGKEAFSRWLAAYAAALSNGNWTSCAKLFTEDAIFLPTPFDSPVRGGDRISAHLHAAWSRFDRVDFTAEAIAPGWAHWHAAAGLDVLEESVRFDGLLNVEFTGAETCTRLVLWTESLSPHEDDILAQRDA